MRTQRYCLFSGVATSRRQYIPAAGSTPCPIGTQFGATNRQWSNFNIKVSVNSDTFLLLNYIYECQTKCKECFNACLEERSLDTLRKCLKLTVECANVCELTASSIVYEGDFRPEVLALCIRACEECRIECSVHNSLHCVECAALCGECTEACRNYIRTYPPQPALL